MTRTGPWTRWVVLGAAVLLIALVAGRPEDAGRPLDPRSGDPSGTRALVLLLEELGAEVDLDRAVPDAGTDVALVLFDDLDEGRRDALLAWVEAGGTLVVTDPASPLAPAPLVDGVVDLGRACAIEALGDVEEVEALDGVAFAVEEPLLGCFQEDGAAFVVLAERGAGHVVGVAGPSVFTNEVIGDADHALLAASLLAPVRGSRVAVVEAPLVGVGDEGLTDLIGDGVRTALWQLAIAFVVYALWRARRLGRPVVEPQPVELAASELVVAVGNLLQQAGRSEQAANLVRDDLRRRLASRLGVGPATPAEEVAELASARSGVASGRLLAVLAPAPVGGDGDLVALAAAAEALRQDVTRV